MVCGKLENFFFLGFWSLQVTYLGYIWMFSCVRCFFYHILIIYYIGMWWYTLACGGVWWHAMACSGMRLLGRTLTFRCLGHNCQTRWCKDSFLFWVSPLRHLFIILSVVRRSYTCFSNSSSFFLQLKINFHLVRFWGFIFCQGPVTYKIIFFLTFFLSTWN